MNIKTILFFILLFFNILNYVKKCRHINYIDYNIFLGDYTAANDINLLLNNNITDILVVGLELSKVFPKNFTYKQIHIDDYYQENIFKYFYDSINFIENYKKNVYIHCYMGISRSSTIVIAYIMYKKKISFKEAFNFVKEKRNCVFPNVGFADQLILFEKYLKNNNYNINNLNNIKLEDLKKQYNKEFI